MARFGGRVPNRGNVVEDPLWDRIADGGNPGCQGQGATHPHPRDTQQENGCFEVPAKPLGAAGMGAKQPLAERRQSLAYRLRNGCIQRGSVQNWPVRR
jgi:hypothetical protein